MTPLEKKLIVALGDLVDCINGIAAVPPELRQGFIEKAEVAAEAAEDLVEKEIGEDLCELRDQLSAA